MAPDEAQKRAEDEAAHEEMDRLAKADELPSDLSKWPTGKAKFLTLGGSDDEDRYGEGATAGLGPAEVVHHEDGSVSVAGKPVDNPEDVKGEPIPGGATDPNAPAISGERKNK